jgi:nucleoside-diphosphate-sugar epimerase
MPSAVVFGGSGQMGAAAAGRLLSSGWTVWMVTRDGRLPPGGLLDRGALLLDGTGRSRAEVIRGIAKPIDAVFDPTAYDAADASDLLQVKGHFGGLVVVSSASVYAAPDGRSLVAASQEGVGELAGPIGEHAPVVSPGESSYAGRKVALERALLGSGVAVSVLRPCAVHGPYSTHPREWWFIKRALDGRKAVPVAYGARSIFHTSSARGVAELALRCMEQPAERLLNVADDDAPSVREIAASIAELTDLDIQIAPFEGPPVGPTHVGSTPWSTEHAFVLDTTRARSLGWTGGCYRDNAGPVCRWVAEVARSGDWKAQFSRFSEYGYDPFDYAAEDRFLAAAA